MKKKNVLRNQKGFTLIEIIAVLVILGILAAVAIPKYLSMADEARIKSAQGAIAEVKGRLSSAQAKYMMENNGTAPSAGTLFTYAGATNQYGGNLLNLGTDYTITMPTSTSPLVITVTNVQSNPVSVVGNFFTANGT